VPFELRYHPDVKTVDIQKLDAKMKIRIRHAIETGLTTEPQQYGTPLRKTLHGFWKLRVGYYRLIFKIVGAEVRVLGIIHRKKVYEAIDKRLS